MRTNKMGEHKMENKPVCIPLAAGVIALLLASSAFAGEGFGTFRKRTASLERTTPPVVRIDGTKIAVTAKAQTADRSGLADSLASLLESKLLNADPRLSSASNNPDTLIEATIVDSQGSEHSENRVENRIVENGVDGKGRKQYRNAQFNVSYKVIKYHLGVAYKVQDVRSHKNLYANTLSLNLGGDYREGVGAPEISTLQSQGIETIAHDIAQRLTPSTEQIGVLLPRGSLDDIANLAEAKLWNKYLEALESMPQKAKAEDESYRQYALGLSHEALGYSAENPETALKYLQQASIHYNNALAANPKEKYFSLPYDRLNFSFLPGVKTTTETFAAPPERVRTALIRYQRTKEFQTDSGPGAAGGSKSLSSTNTAVAVDNASVIDMVKAGLGDEVILTSLTSAERTDFDVSPHGLIELSQAKVSKKVIQQIQVLSKRQKKR
jgi:hypothetical protein